MVQLLISQYEGRTYSIKIKGHSKQLSFQVKREKIEKNTRQEVNTGESAVTALLEISKEKATVHMSYDISAAVHQKSCGRL